MKKLALVVSLLVAFRAGSFGSGESPTPATTDQLQQTEARGRALAEYLGAVRRSAEVIEHQLPGESLQYVGKRNGREWTVVAGSLSETGDCFLISYAVTGAADSASLRIQKSNPIARDTGFYYLGARAIRTALGDLKLLKNSHSFDVAVLPDDSGMFYVYVLAAQTVPGRYVLGPDFRVLVSADATAVVERRQTHRSEIQFREADPRRPAAGLHTHTISDVPEDSDVAYVIARKPSIPEFIKTRDHLFLVHADGTIVRKQ
jgi:hypothetical protein